MPSDHHFTIAGLKWLWRYTRLRGGANGWTYLPDHKSPLKSIRKILIDERLTGRLRLEVEIHEAMHALFPQTSEESVTDAAKDVARILWALGYRIDEEKAAAAG
jgi:hypothetical protein